MSGKQIYWDKKSRLNFSQEIQPFYVIMFLPQNSITMSKSNHFTWQPVFSQLLNLLSKSRILEISRSTGRSERYVKHPDGYTHLVVMLYSVLNHFDSLRELETGMKLEANRRRPQEFFAKVYADLLQRYNRFLADSHDRRHKKRTGIGKGRCIWWIPRP